MDHVSTFTGGMDKDTNKSMLPPNKYRDARNISLITQGLDSSGAITNSDGTVQVFNVPTTSNVIKLINASGTATFTINGVAFSVATSVNPYKEISEAINANTTLNPVSAPNTVVATYTTTYLLLHSGLNSSNQVITSNIVVSGLGNIAEEPNPVTGTGSYVPSQVSPTIIGQTLIRDEFILFTTSNTSRNPGGHDTGIGATASSAGQLWRLTYSTASPTGTPVLTLLYNNYLDLTTFHPIPPSAAEGKYETSSTKGAYWSDNFNELRSFNTADPQGFALDPTLLSIQPELDLSVPILERINDSGGTTSVGVYQAAYRLKNTGGASTTFSKASNLVSLVGGAATLPFRDIVGSLLGGASTKTITWKIDGLDTDYDRLEIVVLFREKREDVPTIDIVFDEPVPASGSFEFTYTGTEVTTPVTINEFLGTDSAFTHCKTIVSKTNQLLAGNTRNVTFDVTFDARAYRFNSNAVSAARKARVEDSQGNGIEITADDVTNNPTTWANVVPDLHDAINPDQSTQDNTGYRFQSDGSTLGGQGLNISYTFKTVLITGDDVKQINNIGVSPYGFNSRFTNPQPAAFTVNNNTFENNYFYDSFKSPYKASALKGYQHDETYAFAIRFFDKQGRPGFAKWIADIRMPLIFEENGLKAGTSDHFPISDIGGFNGAQRIGVLIPEFTVNIPAAIQEKIGGFEIIRTERKVQDKTVVAAGTLHPASFNSVGRYHAITPRDKTLATGADPYTSFTPNNSHTIEGLYASFRSPEFSFLQFPGFQTGDSIKIIANQVNTYNGDSTAAGGTGADNEFLFAKNYTEASVTDTVPGAPASAPGEFMERSLDNAQLLSRNGSGTTTTALTVLNKTDEQAGSSTLGDISVFLEWPSSKTIHYNIGQVDKFYALYKRNISSQYGGNTYSQRASRKYISIGHFVPISPSSASSFTVDAHGGDIFTTVWDTQRGIKNWVSSPPANKRSITYWQPVQSILNTEWRHGDFVNKNGIPNSAGSGVDLGEDYLYNTVYSSEDLVKQAFPKPAVFTDIQEYDTRVHLSGVKINGEQSNSWGLFKTLDYRDVEGNKGPITALLYLKDNIYAIQEGAVCALPINQNVLIPDNSSSTLELGTGQGIGKPVYLSTNDGSTHQWSCITSDDSIYFYQAANNNIIQLRGETQDLSLIKGMYSYFQANLSGSILTTDNPIDDTINPRAGVVAAYDADRSDILFTFHDVQGGVKSAFTLAFNEAVGAFTSFYDFAPTIYINDLTNLFSSNDGNTGWIHNLGNKGQFYGTNFTSTLSVLANTNYPQTKVYDNIEWATEVLDPANANTNFLNETWATLRARTDHQNSDFITLTPNSNIKRRERTWNIQVPRNKVIRTSSSVDILNPVNLNAAQTFTDRLRDKSMQIDLTFNNFSNSAYKELICPYIKTRFRVSPR